jgi:hypothetical protein
MKLQKNDIGNSELDKKIKAIKPSSIIPSVLIGISILMYLLIKQYQDDNFQKIVYRDHTSIWLVIGVLILVLRQFSYMARLYILGEGSFSWKKCFELIIIWEFSSAISPTSVGGSAIALILLKKEGMTIAKSSTIITYTIIVDAIFFLVGIPIFYYCFGKDIIPSDISIFGGIGGKMVLIATYIFKLSYTMIFIWGIFINTVAIERLLIFIGKLPYFKKFQTKFYNLSKDLIIASSELKNKSWKYHFIVMATTIAAWFSRFFLIVCLIIAFSPYTLLGIKFTILIFARFETMFLFTLLFPTPGGAGFVEIAFSAFLLDYIPNSIAISIAFVWRLMEYYSYLLLGTIIIPNWIRKIYNNNLEDK